MSNIHLTADIPADAPPDVKTKMRGEAIAAVLELAVKDPEIRLRLILGEAYCRFAEVADWIVDEIAKDEVKVPGLTRLAGRFSHDPIAFAHPIKDEEVAAAQQALLMAAVYRIVCQEPDAPTPQIERDASL